ncbi:beta-defensin 104A-like [Sorex fumeus]|uniref:beta-defensin 104A-like n=1 Tax=Sorex fumeus TaxID=62283 RepID=UPI0024ADC4A7|nr:beta-defensin 104A-like [Sorex fumeus]
MRTLLLLLALLSRVAPGSSLEINRICGYGTAVCRVLCKEQESQIGKCPNTNMCCLRKWNSTIWNVVKY